MAVNDSRRFNTFNAKFASAEIVASTFIPPPQWRTLIQNNHTLLVGPRGAGKTTLLKMLQSRALAAWDHDEAAASRGAIGFTGVFVSTDRAWSEQISALGDHLSDEHSALLGLATFWTHVLHALVGAAAERIHDPDALNPVSIDAGAEASIASECARAWGLTNTPIVTLRALRHALTDRIADIAALAHEESLLGGVGRNERLATRLPLTDFVNASLPLIDRFNAAAGESDALWCYLFDELELAPANVLNHLMRALRGGDGRLLYKLSLAPYTSGAEQLKRTLAGQQAHDYSVVALTYPHKVQGYAFCRALLARRLNVKTAELDEGAILGRSELASDPEDLAALGTAYRSDTRQTRRFKRLAENDETFRAWLEQKDIDLDRLEQLDPRQRASTLRKVTTLVGLRLEYRTTDDAFRRTHRRRRPRKSHPLFTGVPALYDMSEGNPRWFMNLVAPLLDEVERPVTRPRQWSHIRDVIRLFRAVLTALPLPQSAPGRNDLGVLPVLDAIGTRLAERLVDDDFNADPPGKFKVDDNVPEEFVEDLQFALNAGGIIHMPEADDDAVLHDLRGHTFRLAYMLAPQYPITLTTGGRTVDLSTLLADRKPSWSLSRQLELDAGDRGPSVDDEERAEDSE